MYIHISAVNRKRPLTDLTFSFNLPYVGTLPETVKLLLQFFLQLIWLVRQFLWLYFAPLSYHFYYIISTTI